MGAPLEPPHDSINQAIGWILRVGVLLSALLIATGGVLFLVAHGSAPMDFSQFQGEPEQVKTLSGILRSSVALDGPGLIMLGLLVLLLTPVTRVLFSIFAFLKQKDWLLSFVALVVLGILLSSIISGYG